MTLVFLLLGPVLFWWLSQPDKEKARNRSRELRDWNTPPDSP